VGSSLSSLAASSRGSRPAGGRAAACGEFGIAREKLDNKSKAGAVQKEEEGCSKENDVSVWSFYDP
jgi:hypothetical protein